MKKKQRSHFQSLNPSSLPPVLWNQIVWTKHARERANTRKISEEKVVDILLHPFKIFPAQSKGSYKFIGQVDDRRLHIIASPNPQQEWVIVSVWVRGEDDPQFWLERLIGRAVEWVMSKIFPKR